MDFISGSRHQAKIKEPAALRYPSLRLLESGVQLSLPSHRGADRHAYQGQSEASECCRLITAESVSNLEAVSILAAVSMTAAHNYDLYDLT